MPEKIFSASKHIATFFEPPEVPVMLVRCRCGWEQTVASEEEAPRVASKHFRTVDDEVWVEEVWSPDD